MSNFLWVIAMYEMFRVGCLFQSVDRDHAAVWMDVVGSIVIAAACISFAWDGTT